IGFYPVLDTRLSFANGALAISSVSTGSISIAENASSKGQLSLDSASGGQTVNLQAVGNIWVGRALNGDGTLNVKNQADFRYSNPPPLFASEFIIGDRGTAHVTVQSGGRMTATNQISNLTLAREVGSKAFVTIDGAVTSAQWSNTSNLSRIGDFGDA